MVFQKQQAPAGRGPPLKSGRQRVRIFFDQFAGTIKKLHQDLHLYGSIFFSGKRNPHRTVKSLFCRKFTGGNKQCRTGSGFRRLVQRPLNSGFAAGGRAGQLPIGTVDPGPTAWGILFKVIACRKCQQRQSCSSVMSNSVRPHRQQPTRLRHPWDSPGKNTGVACHFLLRDGWMASPTQ